MVEDLSGSMSFPRSWSGTQQRGYKSIRLPKDELFNNIRQLRPARQSSCVYLFRRLMGLPTSICLFAQAAIAKIAQLSRKSGMIRSQCGSHVVPLVIV
jgi:hypothetical protein